MFDQLVKQIQLNGGTNAILVSVFLSGCTTIRSRRSHLSGNQFWEYQQDSVGIHAYVTVTGRDLINKDGK